MVEFARSLSKIDSESDEIKYEPDKSYPREIYLKRRTALKRQGAHRNLLSILKNEHGSK